MIEIFIEQEQQKNYSIENNKLKEQEKEIIDHILWCYTQIKNPTFFDVIPILWCYTQIKNPQHPYEEDRDNWPKVDRQKRSGSEVIGGVDLRLIGGLGRLVGQWRRALVAATLRMSQAGSGESEIERWEFERVGLREIREMRASDESDWERHGVRIKEWKKMNQRLLF